MGLFASDKSGKCAAVGHLTDSDEGIVGGNQRANGGFAFGSFGLTTGKSFGRQTLHRDRPMPPGLIKISSSASLSTETVQNPFRCIVLHPVHAFRRTSDSR